MGKVARIKRLWRRGSIGPRPRRDFGVKNEPWASELVWPSGAEVLRRKSGERRVLASWWGGSFSHWKLVEKLRKETNEPR